MRYTPGNNLTFEGLVGRLTAFALLNFYNFTPTTIESTFKSQLVINKKGKENV